MFPEEQKPRPEGRCSQGVPWELRDSWFEQTNRIRRKVGEK